MPSAVRVPRYNADLADYLGLRSDPTAALMATQRAKLQAAFDALEGTAIGGTEQRTIRLPEGKIYLDKPLVIRAANTALIGSPSGGTVISPAWGSGYIIVAQSRRAAPTMNDPLVSGGNGNALLLGHPATAPQLALLHINIDSLLDCSALTEFSLEFTSKPVTDTNADGFYPLIGCGGRYGVENFTGVEIRENPATGYMQVVWGGVTHVTPNPVFAHDDLTAKYYLLTFDGSDVNLWVGEPGQTAVNVLSFSSPSGTVPMQASGVEPWSIGAGSDGFGSDQAGISRQRWFSGVRWSDTVRQTSAFTCPTTAPTQDDNTLYLCNFEWDDPFFVCYTKPGTLARGSETKSYLLPFGTTETQFGDVTIKDIVIQARSGSSGILVYDTIGSLYENINFVQPYNGFAMHGSFYGSRVKKVGGTAHRVALEVIGQGEAMVFESLNLLGSAFAILQVGSIGGTYITPIISSTNSFAAIYINSSNETVMTALQLDDEGQAPDQEHAIICHGATLKLVGGLWVRDSNGPTVEVVGHGGFQGFAGWFINYTETFETFVKIYDEPQSTVTLLGCQFAAGNDTATATDHPEWSLVERDGTLSTPALKIRDVAMPVSVGTSGQVLTSNGSDAATFQSLPKATMLAPGASVDQLIANLVAAGYMEQYEWRPNALTGLVDVLEADPAYLFKDTARTQHVSDDGDPVKAWVGRFNGTVFNVSGGASWTAKYDGTRWRVVTDAANAAQKTGLSLSDNLWAFLAANRLLDDVASGSLMAALHSSGDPHYILTQFDPNRLVLQATDSGSQFSATYSDAFAEFTPQLISAHFKSGDQLLSIDNDEQTASISYTASNPVTTWMLAGDGASGHSPAQYELYAVALVEGDLDSEELANMRAYIGGKAGL